MLPQIINEYKQTNLFIKKYRISIISASANESGNSFFPSNRAKRIVAVAKTCRHYALDNVIIFSGQNYDIALSKSY